MDLYSLYKQQDVEIRIGGLRMVITKELRARVRRLARLTSVLTGALGAVMGTVILVGSLIAEHTLVPVLACAAAAILTIRMVSRR